MPKVSPMIYSFNAGELSPTLDGRIDLEKYKKGCKALDNFIPKIHGPASKRPGTRFVREVKNSADNVRLIPFQFNTEQAYILEFGDKYIRFYMDGGVILSSGSPYEITSPYSHTDVQKIQFAQSADVMYLVHENYPPQKLSRTGHTAWTIQDVQFDWVAFNTENISTDTMTASATSGVITIISSSPQFNGDSVGDHIKFSEVIASKYTAWGAGVSISAGDYRTYNENLYKAVSTGTTSNRPPIHLKGTESDGGVNWEYQHSGEGYVKITGYTSTTSVSATVIKLLPTSSTIGTERWSKGAWSVNNGYPRAVTFYEDRLWFAGSIAKPQTIWASVTSSYEDFKPGTKDDDSLNFTINSQEVNSIYWLSPSKVLAIGTAGGEFIASASSSSQVAITPTDIKISPQTNYGSSQVRPYRIGSATLFMQRSGRKMREFTYNFDSDSYVAPDLTLLSNHILDGGVVETSYSQEPNQIVWLVRTDGSLIGLTYERQEQVVGWHRQSLGGNGKVRSISTIPHWDGDQDSTWLVVERTINNSVVKYIEYIEKELFDDDSFYVDSGLSYTGAPVASVSGLSHLEGETVRVLTDGYIHPDQVVSGGSITLQQSASKVHVGLPYNSTIKTMRLEAGAAEGVAQGKAKRIVNIVMRLYKTGSGLFYGSDENNLDELFLRDASDLMNNPIPLFTGDTDITPWTGHYEQDAYMVLVHKSALPCTVIALMPQMTTYDR